MSTEFIYMLSGSESLTTSVILHLISHKKASSTKTFPTQHFINYSLPLIVYSHPYHIATCDDYSVVKQGHHINEHKNINLYQQDHLWMNAL